MRNKLFSFITILGLATGLTVTLLLTIYVRHEFSYNSFHQKKDRIYRLVSRLGTNELQDYSISLRLSDSILSNSVPELEHIVQLYGMGQYTFVEGENQHKNVPFVFTDPSLFDVFTFTFLRGTKEGAFVIDGYRSDTLLKVITPIFAVALGVIAGLYPAIFVSGFNPYRAIKGEVSISGGVQRFIKVLVVLQFGVAIFLISSLIVMQRQIDYMKNADLGVDSKRVIAVMGFNSSMQGSYKAIRDALLANPIIEQVSASDHLFGGGTSGQSIDSYEESPKKNYGINEYRVKPGFCELMGMHFVLGRPFDASISSDSAGIILNESAVKMLGLKDPLNARVEFYNIGQKTKIIGVVKDFNYQSLESSIAPIALTMYRDRFNFIMVKHADVPLKDALSAIESTIKRFNSAYVLDYYIVDDLVRNKYRVQEQTSKMTSYSAVLSIILSLLGLYALSMYLVDKRTKEIGVRKVNGATRLQILALLLQTYTKQVVIAFVIAAPITYFIMREWLNGFAYRISLGVLPFIAAGVLCLVVALLTVGFQTWRATGLNPVESLRYE